MAWQYPPGQSRESFLRRLRPRATPVPGFPASGASARHWHTTRNHASPSAADSRPQAQPGSSYRRRDAFVEELQWWFAASGSSTQSGPGRARAPSASPAVRASRGERKQAARRLGCGQWGVGGLAHDRSSQVVVGHDRLDTNFDEIPPPHRPRPTPPCRYAIDLMCLPDRACLDLAAAYSVYHRPNSASDALLESLGRDQALQLVEPLESLLLERLGNVVI